MSGLGQRNSVLYMVVTIPEWKGAILGKHVPDKPNTPSNCELENWTGPCSVTRQGQTLDCKRWTSVSAAKWGGGVAIAHGGQSLISTIALLCIVVCLIY